MRGAAEVKDHAWIKYFPWKDLYEKKIEPTFTATAGVDPWDKKYCEAPDKLGEETKERYEKILRNEATHEAFKNYYYFSMEDADKLIQMQQQQLQASTTAKKYLGPSGSQPNLSLTKQPTLVGESTNLTGSINKPRLEKSASIDTRASTKYKKIAVSSSNPSLLKQYKPQTSSLYNNSTGSGSSSTSSLNVARQHRSNSYVNLNNNK